MAGTRVGITCSNCPSPTVRFFFLRCLQLAQQIIQDLAPPKLVGTGEYAIGIAYLHALTKYRAQGFDIQQVAPPQSVGDVDCIAILKNTKHLAAAKKFVDFMLSKEAQELMSSLDFTIPVNPDAKPVEGALPIADIDLIDYDVKKASDQRKEVLDRWTKEVK